MSSDVREFRENPDVDPVDPVDPVDFVADFLKNKSFCVRWYYRTDRKILGFLYVVIAGLFLTCIGIVAAKAISNKTDEYLILVPLLLVTITCLPLSYYVAESLSDKHEFMKSLRGGHEPRRRRCRSSEKKRSDEDLLKLKDRTGREDSTSISKGGENLNIPVVEEGIEGMSSANVQVHKTPTCSPGSSDSPEIEGQAEETAASSKKQDRSDEKALLEESAIQSVKASSEVKLPRRNIFYSWKT